jgi:hypothetical protein
MDAYIVHGFLPADTGSIGLDSRPVWRSARGTFSL